MNTLLFFTLLALAAPIFGEENAETKKQEKRGLVGVGYGGHYPGAYGAHGFAGYGGYGGYPAFGGFGHGYVPSAAPLYPAPLLGHGLGHRIAAVAPSIAHHGYNAPLPVAHGYSHGYNAASLLSGAPAWRVGYNGYNGLHGAGYGHSLNYVNGW